MKWRLGGLAYSTRKHQPWMELWSLDVRLSMELPCCILHAVFFQLSSMDLRAVSEFPYTQTSYSQHVSVHADFVFAWWWFPQPSSARADCVRSRRLAGSPGRVARLLPEGWSSFRYIPGDSCNHSCWIVFFVLAAVRMQFQHDSDKKKFHTSSSNMLESRSCHSRFLQVRSGRAVPHFSTAK